jgi:hypothetical protein
MEIVIINYVSNIQFNGDAGNRDRKVAISQVKRKE